jgi:hypothetical protein
MQMGGLVQISAHQVHPAMQMGGLCKHPSSASCYANGGAWYSSAHQVHTKCVLLRKRGAWYTLSASSYANGGLDTSRASCYANGGLGTWQHTPHASCDANGGLDTNTKQKRLADYANGDKMLSCLWGPCHTAKPPPQPPDCRVHTQRDLSPTNRPKEPSPPFAYSVNELKSC